LGRRTPLYDLHVELGARMVDFGGWDMPVNYGSQIEEHHAVRRDAGVFDVSHMCVIDARGGKVREFLAKLVANDVAKLTTSGKALYSCMLNEAGGVIDDLIIYFIDESFFRIVVNAGTRDKDLAWMRRVAGAIRRRTTERTDLAMVAVQGPQCTRQGRRVAAGRANRAAASGAGALLRQGVSPMKRRRRMVRRAHRLHRRGWLRDHAARGRGRETLARSQCSRREVRGPRCARHVAPRGGHEPLRQRHGRGRRTARVRSFLDRVLRQSRARLHRAQGAGALKAAGLKKKFVALVLEDRGVLRGHQKVVTAAGDGEITSGTFSPTMEKSIALARVPRATGATVQVDVRGKLLNARVVKAPFVRKGQVLVA
jgi:aminomethyltransferase